MSPFFNLYLTIIQPTTPLSLRIFTRSLPEQAQSVHAAAESQSLGDQVQGRLAMAGPATDGGDGFTMTPATDVPNRRLLGSFTLWLCQNSNGKSPFLMGNSTIYGHFQWLC